MSDKLQGSHMSSRVRPLLFLVDSFRYHPKQHPLRHFLVVNRHDGWSLAETGHQLPIWWDMV